MPNAIDAVVATLVNKFGLPEAVEDSPSSIHHTGEQEVTGD